MYCCELQNLTTLRSYCLKLIIHKKHKGTLRAFISNILLLLTWHRDSLTYVASVTWFCCVLNAENASFRIKSVLYKHNVTDSVCIVIMVPNKGDFTKWFFSSLFEFYVTMQNI